MKRKKILITGGSGKLGKYIINELKDKYNLIIFDKSAPLDKSVEFFKGNILKRRSIKKACGNVDTVIHLAALVVSDNPEEIFKVNVLGTVNLLESCVEKKIRRVIFASSISCLGFVYQKQLPHPQYFPIDEKHPANPKDTYGLSKLIGEYICQAYTERYGIETICLRPPWIWFPEEAKTYEPFVKIHEAWPCLLWAYQDARDAARAFRLAIAVRGVKHERILVTSNDNGTKYPTFNLIARHYPSLKKVCQNKLTAKASLVNIRKAKKILNYRPKYTWKDIVKI